MKSIVKFLGFIIVVLALVFIPVIVYYISLLQEREEIRQQVLALSTIAKPTPIPEKPVSQLGKIIEKNFASYGTDYAVVVKNLKTDEEYRFNENKKFDSASLYKLWIMGVAFQKIKDGQIDENQVLSASQKRLDNALSAVSPTPTPEGSTESEETDASSVSMTAREAIEKMIEFSDNYAALLIASKAGTFSVTNFLKNYNLTNSSFRQPPQTTANDIALYYEKLYKGEIVDKEYSEKMINLLKLQAINDRIPKYLPKNTVVAHKTGELFGSKHDAGIVFSGKGDYIIVVMSETKNPKVAAENTAKFSKEIFDYFQSIN